MQEEDTSGTNIPIEVSVYTQEKKEITCQN